MVNGRVAKLFKLPQTSRSGISAEDYADLIRDLAESSLPDHSSSTHNHTGGYPSTTRDPRAKFSRFIGKLGLTYAITATDPFVPEPVQTSINLASIILAGSRETHTAALDFFFFFFFFFETCSFTASLDWR
ncbi:hypothetical protein TI39_contig4341g00001 [Zymoseptoria brevis]|uniref:Uncharacterized protein n=1 Tax=Zymoseptoria brevis TaxID=1047168 RepID=A0A0F4G7D5_9PEZI|nr:hypothetical protein TI39_contig4341g00001 [Zymoseptoria brevis]